MRRWGIRKKVLVVTLVPTLLTTLLLGLFFTYSWVNNIENLLKDRGESLSRQLAAGSEYGLFTANRSLLSSLSNALLEEQDVRSITFYGSDGQRMLIGHNNLVCEMSPFSMITLCLCVRVKLCQQELGN